MIFFFLFLIFFAILGLLLWFAFAITSGLVLTGFWLFIKIPLAIMLFLLGLILCLTLILLPLGILCFRAGFKLLIPGI